jgi:hypothetical protein
MVDKGMFFEKLRASVLICHRRTGRPMREIHALGVKFTREHAFAGSAFCEFAGICAFNSVGTGIAKLFPEIKLTEGELQVESADCPRTKKQKTEKL